jgi:DNA-binding NarL/FixJ family response regulator
MKSSLLALSNDIASLADQIGPSVVAVHNGRRKSSSGIHWRKNLIVTTEHVELDGREGDMREVLDEYAAGESSVIGLVDEDAPAGLSSMLTGNVRGLLRKQVTSDELVAAVRAAAAGPLVLQSDDYPANARSLRSQPSGFIQPLTPREREVLEYVADGISNKEIASRLEISDHTVKFHIASIMSKLGAATRTEAVTIAIRNGVLMV